MKRGLVAGAFIIAFMISLVSCGGGAVPAAPAPPAIRPAPLLEVDIPPPEEPREVRIITIRPGPEIPNPLMVADFEPYSAVQREVVSRFGLWSLTPFDETQSIRQTIETIDRGGRESHAIAIRYDLDSPNPAVAGLWIQFGEGPENLRDLSAYDHLEFFAMGAGEPEGCSNSLRLELKTPEDLSPVEITGITNSWRRFVIPLDSFSNIRDWKRIREIVFVLDEASISDLEGILFLDDIAFTRE